MFKGLTVGGVKPESPNIPDEWFYTGKNEIIYQENLTAIDLLGASLAPFGFDIIADVIGTVYTGYYGEWGTSANYISGIFAPVVTGGALKITRNILNKLIQGKLVFKWVEGSFILVESNRMVNEELVLLLKKYAPNSNALVKYHDEIIGAGIDANKIDDQLAELLVKSGNGRIQVLSQISGWSDDLLLKLSKDLKENPKFAKEFFEGVKTNPRLVDGWVIARRAGIEDVIRLNTVDLEKIVSYKSLTGRSADNIIREIESCAITVKGSTRSWIDIVSSGGGNKIGQIGDYAVHERAEVFYRGISASDYEYLMNTGLLRATSETFTSPSLEYIQAVGYGGDGYILKFYVDKGTLKALENIGVRNDGSAKILGHFSDMPSVISVNKWTESHALFKTEGAKHGIEQINIGLGKGSALEIFNSNLKAFEVVQ